MSTEKSFKEAKRWFITAADDLDTSKILKERDKYAHSCFHAQQSGEKAIKALWYFIDADPWGHSITLLIRGLEDENKTIFQEMRIFEHNGTILDRFYIPTRYPNGLPEMTPDMAYKNNDAEDAIMYAGEILEKVKNILNI